MANTQQSIAGKTLVMLVGPTAVGKSTIMNAVVARDPEFKRALGFTTRPARPNDEPGQYRYLSHEDVRTMIKKGETLQHILNPANGHVYGTSAADYPGRYNLKDTLSSAVADFELLPFNRTIAISMSVPTDPWRDWLNLRYPEASEERTLRLKEAKQSIEWSLSQGESHYWIINHPGKEALVAAELIDLVRGTRKPVPVPQEPQNMLAMINDLLSYD